MLNALQNKKKEDGFTLIELMVVVLIIAILVAIAVPTFLGARSSSQDRAAQSDLRNALSAAKIIYSDTETYVQTKADLEAVEPSLTFSDTLADASTTTVGILDVATEIYFVRESAGGDFFGLWENETTGTGSCSSSVEANIDTVAKCDALNNDWAG